MANNVNNIKELSIAITKFIKEISKEVILIIDEVDKSSNNQLFLSFIGMLRNKYLLREMGKDYTFKSVILASVYDVKQASKIYDFEVIAYSCEKLSRSFLEKKLKLRPEQEAKYNSPWNIAADFNVDMSFSPAEISTMLKEYCTENDVSMDIKYNNFKYIIEMKVWRGQKYHQDGVNQLCDYLDINSLDKGYLVIFNFNKNKEFKGKRKRYIWSLCLDRVVVC